MRRKMEAYIVDVINLAVLTLWRREGMILLSN